ncbi:hypothetical protein A1351_20270 [Methylosinus sp. R-45379]|uniref:helix-turn-helix domain-containing protein n=1 Tax=Methylosinus sp. R-45379 TaxID=980563 RepID=UPI0007C9861D|nr:helix-turn-helix transcriptional regulator [Methylosinus sp. R-45379]OAI22906.1 hypothetical protein A1351_20270 [Methylosinus sp. R-45379]
MRKPLTIHEDDRRDRLHYIEEWIDHRGLKQADVCRELGISKGTVSKWCSGDLPGEDNVKRLAVLLNTDPISLFRHPLDDWLTHFFQNRRDEELSRMVDVLRAAFPRDDIRDLITKSDDQTETVNKFGSRKKDR